MLRSLWAVTISKQPILKGFAFNPLVLKTAQVSVQTVISVLSNKPQAAHSMPFLHPWAAAGPGQGQRPQNRSICIPPWLRCHKITNTRLRGRCDNVLEAANNPFGAFLYPFGASPQTWPKLQQGASLTDLGGTQKIVFPQIGTIPKSSKGRWRSLQFFLGNPCGPHSSLNPHP